MVLLGFTFTFDYLYLCFFFFIFSCFYLSWYAHFNFIWFSILETSLINMLGFSSDGYHIFCVFILAIIFLHVDACNLAVFSWKWMKRVTLCVWFFIGVFFFYFGWKKETGFLSIGLILYQYIKTTFYYVGLTFVIIFLCNRI